MISVELIEAITDKLRSRGLTANGDDVRSALDDASLVGWRFVRTDGCPNPDAALGKCGCVDLTVTEEWKP